MLGTLLTGVFAAKVLGGYSPNGLGMVAQIIAQLKGILVTLLWSGLISYLILRVLAATVGLRVDAQEETEGLDLSQHDERGYDF